jgi:hypothetical protein
MKPQLQIFLKALLLAILMILAIVHMSSCKSQKPLSISTKDSTSHTLKQIPFDSLVWIKNHSGKEQVFTNCDSLLKSLAANQNTLTTSKDGVKLFRSERRDHRF